MPDELLFLLIPCLAKLFLNFLDYSIHILFSVLSRLFEIIVIFEFRRVVVIWIVVLLVWDDKEIIILAVNSLVVPLIKIVFFVIIVILVSLSCVWIVSSFVLKMMGHYFHMVFESNLAFVYLNQIVREPIHFQKFGNVLAFFHDRQTWGRPNHSHFVQA